jgi:predicted enzyme related to lactoylglutathione lyase
VNFLHPFPVITSLAFVVYPVTDIARSRAFYEATLGLKLGETFGDSWIEYEAGSATFAITNAFAATAPASSAAFEVDDLDNQLAALKSAGVPVQGGINDFPSCRMALITDPDGNTLCMHQRKKV